MSEETETITITLSVKRVIGEGGTGMPQDLALANQLHTALRDASRQPGSLFTYVGADIEWPGYAGAFSID